MPKYRLLTPGPVSVPERVLLAMARTLLHHRAPEFIPIFQSVRDNLKRVFQTQEDVLVLACSGTGGMEAAVANVLCAGDRVIVVRGGKFGERWAELCRAYGVEPVCVDVEWGRAVDPAAVRAAFRQAPDARALLVQACETSTGVYHPIRELAALVREPPERLLLVDAISALAVHDLPMDAWGLDVVVGASQKAFMLPPGLAFVALSQRARGWLGRSRAPRYYFDLRRELEVQPRNQTQFTPALSLLVGLHESLCMILAEGLSSAIARHRSLAEATRAAMRAVGLELYAQGSPCSACTVVRVPAGLDAGELLRRVRDQHGIALAEGQGRAAGKVFRIGHLGNLDRFDALAAVSAIELVLCDLGYPMKLGEGTRAAAECFRDSPTDVE